MTDPSGHVGASGNLTVTYHQIKSGLYRNIFVDGLWFGVTPGGLVHVAVYSERSPIPTEITMQIALDSSTADEDRTKRVVREGVFRELEAGLIMTPENARLFGQWLIMKSDELMTLKQNVAPTTVP
jgi:hypothetical protein